MPKESDDLTRKDNKKQTTKRAKLRIPVPDKGSVLRALRKAAPKKPRESGEASR